MRFIFTSDIQIGTFGSQANGTESYSCEPGHHDPQRQWKYWKRNINIYQQYFPEGTEISPAGKFIVS